jgi:hypothetical protein
MSPVESPAGAQQIESLIREFEALKASIVRARRIRQGLLLVAVAFVALTCVIFFNFASSLKSQENVDTLLKLAQERLGDRTDSYMREVQTLVDSSAPVLTEAFYAQAKKDLPKYLQSVEKERDTFLANLRPKVEKKLDDQYHAILEKHRETLKREFPAVEDAELQTKMVNNLGLVFDKMVTKYYGDDLKDQMVTLYDSWDQFPPADAPARDESPLEEQFIGHLLELVKHGLTEGGNITMADSGAGAGAAAATAPPTAKPTTKPAAERKERD